MMYLNVAGLSPFNPAIQLEVAATLEQFSRLLYSEEGIQYYRATLQRCREDLAQWLHIDNADGIAFVPNATTASWLVLSRIHWQPGDHILTTTHENSTVLREIFALQSRGIHVHTLNLKSPIELITEIEHLLTSHHVRAIIISHVSHIDGRILPIEQLAKLAQTHQASLIIDGAQAIGHIPVNFHDWQPDAYFFPGHKWCAGPMGTGALILGKPFAERDEIHKDKGQEDRLPPWTDFELGTQNIGGVAGFAKACTIKHQEGLGTGISESFREEVREALSRIPGIEILEWEGPHSPGILSFSCLDKQIGTRFLSHHPIIAWKTFPHLNNPKQTDIRLSWSADIPKTDRKAVLTLLRNLS